MRKRSVLNIFDQYTGKTRKQHPYMQFTAKHAAIEFVRNPENNSAIHAAI